MASEGAECYLVGPDGFVFGPFRSERHATRAMEPNDIIMWLTYEEIDEYGYVRNWNDR